jgi:hypothetical protein
MKIKNYEIVKKGNRITWRQDATYQLGDEGKDRAFVVDIYLKNEFVESKVVLIPFSIIDQWGSDEIITNYILSNLGMQAENDNTIQLVLDKLNSGTITYAGGVAQDNDLILKNYANFLSFQIESYNEGRLDIDEFTPIMGGIVTIELDGENYDIISFVKSLLPLNNSEKNNRLNSCIAALEGFIKEEEQPPFIREENQNPITEPQGETGSIVNN